MNEVTLVGGILIWVAIVMLAIGIIDHFRVTR